MAPRRTWQFGRPQSERRWGSVVVGIAATAVSFALALVSMQSLPRFSASDAASERPVFVPLPAPAATPVTPPRTRTREAPPPRVPAPQQPDRVTPDVPPIVGPVTPPSQPRDTAAAGGNATTDPSAPARGASTGIGAPLAPAGINLGNRVPNTPAVRDSIARAQMIGIPDLARTRAPTGREKAELEESQRQALAVRRRSTTAGNADLVILQGRGMNGVGSVSRPGMVSIDAPLFASGPSRAQRKKNEALFAEYQGRLRRLDDRVLLKRDSIVIAADSIRADSLRRDAAQRDLLAGPRRPSMH